MIVVRDRETGTVIDIVPSFEDGERLVRVFEQTDKAEGTFVRDFYEVAEVEDED